MIRVAAFAAALIAALLIIWAIGNRALRGARPPEPTLATSDIRRQFPDRNENESAARFYSTIARLDVVEVRRMRDVEIDYIAREVASPAAMSAAPPEKLVQFLAKNGPTLRILRAQLASNPQPAWKSRADDLLDAPQPDYILISQLAMTFAADALAERSAHNDAAAWADLNAIWTLAESLWGRPEIAAVLTALSASRMIVAVATKLPPPAPRWWKDFVALDPRVPFAHALEYESWAVRTRAERYPVGEPNEESGFAEAMRRAAEPFVRPLRVMQADARVRDMREVARELGTADPCRAVVRPALARWMGAALRLNRFMIEREGVAKLLVAQQQKPVSIDDHSLCHAAHWIYRPTKDGFELSFAGSIAAPQTRIVTPLTYRR